MSIGAIQLWPSIEFFNESVRAVWSREQALSFSLSPVNLIQLWAPFAFRFRVFAPFEDQQPHKFIVYNGALCTMALAWIAIRWRALPHRRLAVALLVFAGLGLWLAFGRYGGLYPLFARLPVISGCVPRRATSCYSSSRWRASPRSPPRTCWVCCGVASGSGHDRAGRWPCLSGWRSLPW